MSHVTPFLVAPFRPETAPALRALIERIGWDEQYVQATVENAVTFGARPSCAALAAYAEATPPGALLGLCLMEHHPWNNLAQIQGLVVDPAHQRQGVATHLVAAGEAWAQARGARGIYVDTPTLNRGGRAFYNAIGYADAYLMPRYYEDALDGITLQKFFDAGPSGKADAVTAAEPSPSSLLTFDDLPPGWSRDLGSVTVSEAEIIAFARQYDPQPFHIDPEAARAGPFAGVIASGWHTCALIMRLLVEGVLQETAGLGSPGIDALRFRTPVRPGDTLRARVAVADAAPLTRPDRGLLTLRIEAHNQREELVVSMDALTLVRRR